MNISAYMPLKTLGNHSPDIEETMLLAAMRRSLEDDPKSIEDPEQIIEQKYRSLREGSGAHRFDNRFRNFNDVITQSRPRRKDEGPCMVFDNGDESGSDSIESQFERARCSRAFRSSSPNSKRLKSDINTDIIITPKFKTRRSNSDDDHTASSLKTPQEDFMQYSISESDDDHMEGSPKAPQDGSDDEFADLLYNIAQDCLEDDVDLCNFNNDLNFCGFANDNHKCYRNSLLWVLLSCDMILDAIRKHKNDAQGPPCSDFDDFLLQLYDKCQQGRDIKIDQEFEGNKCLKIDAGISLPDQSSTEYLNTMFAEQKNTKQITKDLMSFRILDSLERKNCDGSVTWRTIFYKDSIFTKSCKVVDERCFNNTYTFNIQASGKDIDAVATEIHIVMKLPSIWCLDAANGETPIFEHQFTLSAPRAHDEALPSRGVYQIIGCVSHSIKIQHYVACIFKKNQWICMVFFPNFYSIFSHVHSAH